MYLRTLSWSSVSSKNNIYIKPAIQIFCKDLQNRNVYLKLDALTTNILEFNDAITDEEVVSIYNSYEPKDVSLSIINDHTLAMREPVFEDLNKEIANFKQDPQGLLSSFWEVRNIKPYSWIYVEKYEYLIKKNTNCDIEIKTSEEFIHSVKDKKLDDIKTTKLFWDIETISTDGNFTDAENPAHEIFMISVISEINNKVTAYILTTKNTDTFEEAKFLKYDTEKDLIIGFFDLWIKINPDKCLHYNGDSYDMPYVLDRAKLHKIKIPALGKSLLPSMVVSMNHPSPIGYERDKTILSPGVEKLDLITYFRRFYPGNPNYRLETIGKLYLGEGKSGLEIEEMFKIVKSNDPVKMKTVSWYSYKDSILLYDLWVTLDIENKIENICNDIYCTAEELLRLNETNLISRLFYHVDYATTMFDNLTIDKISYLKPFETKVYKDLYVNKYDTLFNLALMMGIDNIEYNDKIRDRIKHLPTYMKSMVIYSNYVDPNIRNDLEYLINRIEGIIAIDDNFIYTETSNIKNLLLVDKYDYLFVITQSSMIIYKDKNFIRMGLHKISRPKYEYMKIAVDSYLLDYIEGQKVINRKTTSKELSIIDKNLFVIKDKIKPLSSYKDKKNIKYQISEKFDDSVITTWITVKYVYTKDGFKLVNENIDDSYNLDYTKYVKDINEVYKTLNLMIKSS